MDSTQPYEESVLLAQIIDGHESAFLRIYNDYAGEIKKFILLYIKSPELADDLSQEIFIKLWENRRQLTEIKSIRSYLFILARNYTLNTLKRASREQLLMTELLRHYPVRRVDFGDELLVRDYTTHLQNILSTLPPRSREVFSLCREGQQSYEEVATRLGISRNAVKKHMVRSMKTIRESFNKDFGISLSLLLIIFHY